ncbi:MAG TPA: Uma2 family endonuclease [Pyrinomonadaceae bacterium]
MSAQTEPRYTLEEYFELERKSEERFEFWNGEVFCMSGVSPEHAQLEVNFISQLNSRLTGKGCRIFPANIRIKVPSAPPYRYADVSALCGEAKFEEIGGIRAVTNPTLIVEILSGSTEAYDRGEKFTHYQSITSFREYLLIAQHRPHITHLIKQEDGSWIYKEYNDLADIVKLTSMNCELAMSEVYENVSFSSDKAE